jgi:hypothetical protein
MAWVKSRYLEAHVSRVDHSEEGGEDVCGDVEYSEEADQEDEEQANTRRFNADFLLEGAEKAIICEIFVDVGEHGRDEGSDLFEAHLVL